MSEASRHSPAKEEAWSAGTLEEVTSGIFRIALPLPGDALRAVNVYALPHRDGVTLVDGGQGGMPAARQALDAGLRELGFKLSQITEILVTHAHSDHYTLATELRAEVGCRVRLGEGESPNIEAVLSGRRTGLSARLRRGGSSSRVKSPSAGTVEWEAPDAWLRHGDVVTVPGIEPIALRVIETPGHTRGHVVFRADAQRLTFTGDHLLPRITPSIGYEPHPSESPLSRFLASLELLRGMPDTRMLAAHGPITPSVHARVSELLQHHHVRLAECAAAVTRPSTALDVARRLHWTSRQTPYDRLDAFNQMLSVNETLAHLDVLVENEVLEADVVHDVAWYHVRGEG